MINGNRMGRRPILVSEDDNEHASLIQERVKRERPCRTLFIRNIAVSSRSHGRPTGHPPRSASE
jgi:RNA recognition motif-containing protein